MMPDKDRLFFFSVAASYVEFEVIVVSPVGTAIVIFTVRGKRIFSSAGRNNKECVVKQP